MIIKQINLNKFNSSLKKEKEETNDKLENLTNENVNIKIAINDNLSTIKNNKEIMRKYVV